MRYKAPAELGVQLQASCLTDYAPKLPFSMSLLRKKLYQWSFSLLAEPHEICDEESLGPVVWKETPAGDAAAVRCPRNATGKGDCTVGRWSLDTVAREIP